MRTAGWETVLPLLTPHRGFPTSSPVTQQPGTRGCLWMPGHPWVLGWAAAQGGPRDGDAHG